MNVERELQEKEQVQILCCQKEYSMCGVFKVFYSMES